MNLNKIEFESFKQEDYSISTPKIEVFFKNIKNEIIKKINQANLIVGCVAWLTNTEIIRAIAQKEALIIVQKEDFLRPENNNKNWSKSLKKEYDRVSCALERYCFGNLLSKCSFGGDPYIYSGIRCVGNHNTDKNPAFPRMHNKFIVLSKADKKPSATKPRKIKPYAVITGSFNFTYNATNSFENVLYITEDKIVNSYFKEFGQIASMSEPLNWSSKWVSPEWRIGS